MAKQEVDDVDGLDEFMGTMPQPMVMGITPENAPRPAFRLEKLPPRVREKTMMVAQYEEDGEGRKGKLIGFKPEVVHERVEGGYLVHCMKGHKVAIDSLEKLHKMGLGGYVPMLKLSNGGIEGEFAGHVHGAQVAVRSGTTKVA